MALNDFNMTKLPDYQIVWGMLQVEDEQKIKQWIVDNVKNFIHTLQTSSYTTDQYDEFMRKFANNIYNEIHQVGYKNGYDAAMCDNEGDGL